jgi:hypothetical protein
MKAGDRYLVRDVTCSMSGRDLAVWDLSVGGLFAACEDPPMLGQTVSLDLRLPGRDTFSILALVTWINRPDRARAPDLPQGFGVKVTRIAFPDKLALLDLLKRAGLRATRRGGQ